MLHNFFTPAHPYGSFLTLSKFCLNVPANFREEDVTPGTVSLQCCCFRFRVRPLHLTPRVGFTTLYSSRPTLLGLSRAGNRLPTPSYVQDSAEAHSGQGTLAKRRPPHRAVPPCKGHRLSLTYRHPWHGGYFDISLGELDVRDTTSLQRWCRGGVLWHVPNTCLHSPRANVFFTR